jgi:hypothetical protein
MRVQILCQIFRKLVNDELRDRQLIILARSMSTVTNAAFQAPQPRFLRKLDERQRNAGAGTMSN